MMDSKDQIREEMVRLSHLFSQRGWTPATSGNFSARAGNESILITASGKDKSRLKTGDLILVTPEGEPLEQSDAVPSAETILHCEIYKRIPGATAILHTHSIYSALLSTTPGVKAPVVFSDYEILKAFGGVTTHHHTEQLPVFPNEQNMKSLAKIFHDYWNVNPGIHGFLIAGHGLYSWGTDFPEAQRHIEAFEFLLECEYRRLMLRA